MPDKPVPRPVGGAQAWADKAGGPGVFSGVNFQVAVAVMELLTLLTWQGQSPLRVQRVGCESRVGARKGQLGFDLRVTTPEEDRLDEVKASPVPAEIQELLGRLGAFGSGRLVVRLVHGKANKWTRALDKLVEYSREAVDEAGLRDLAGRNPDVQTLLGHVGVADGESVWDSVRRMALPVFLPPDVLHQQIRLAALTLAGDRAQELVARLSARVSEASQRRETVLVSALRDELLGVGLVPVAQVARADGGPLLARAVVVLDRCPVPLPERVLSAALGLAEGGAAALLADLVDAGVVFSDGRVLWRPPGGPPLGATDTARVFADVLSGLLALPEHGLRVRQVPNVVAMTREAAVADPALAARAFRSYDKASKATGDLSAVYVLAGLSLDAAARSVVGGAAASAESLELRGHARICGIAWVQQRVGMLDDAARQMEKARNESDLAASRDNLAFVDKCQGRLSRLRGEDALAAGDVDAAEEWFCVSEQQLRAGLRQFKVLLREPAFARLEEEPGECLALLARTALSAGRLDDAEDLAGQAHAELDYLPDERKAWADTCLLEAEVALHRVRDGSVPDPSAVIAAQERRLGDVLRLFDLDPAPGGGAAVDVGASEIVARTLVLQGVLANEAGRVEDAVRLYEQAAELYVRVDRDSEAYRLRAMALELSGAVPHELLAAVAAAGADDGATVEAHALYLADRPGAHRPEDYWARLVNHGRVTAAARVHLWTDRRAG